MTRTFNFPALLTLQPEGGYVVTFRDVPEAITQGDSLADARLQAQDALEEAIAGRIAGRLGIPMASNVRSNEWVIYLSASMSVKCALYLAFEDLRFSPTEIALKLGIDEREVRCLLDPATNQS